MSVSAYHIKHVCLTHIFSSASLIEASKIRIDSAYHDKDSAVFTSHFLESFFPSETIYSNVFPHLIFLWLSRFFSIEIFFKDIEQ